MDHGEGCNGVLSENEYVHLASPKIVAVHFGAFTKQ